jgi:hypothetical protein
MNKTRLFVLLLMLLAILESALAQSSDSREVIKPGEQKNAEDEREGKALELMAEVINDVRSLRSPENRIRLMATAAETLWNHDEKKARALIEEAAKGLGEIVAGLDPDDPRFDVFSHRLLELRQQILQTASRLDPLLALDFLKATRQPGLNFAWHGIQPNMEAALRLRVASETVAKDPALSLKIAEESLKNGFSHEINGLIQPLYSKDKQLGERLINTIIEKLRAADLQADPMAAYIATNLLTMAIEGKRAALRQPESNGDGGQLRLSDRAISELMEMAVKTAVSIASRDDFLGRLQAGHGHVFFNTLQGMTAEMELYSPAEARMLAGKIEQYKEIGSRQSGVWGKYQSIGATESIDGFLKAIEDAPQEIRMGLYQQAAMRAMNDGDLDRARQIINEKVHDPRYRKELLSNIDRQVMWRSLNEGKIEEARQMIGRFTQKEERAMMLVQLAMNLSGNNDKKRALQLLNEAQSEIGEAIENYGQMQAQLQMAIAYTSLDPGKSFDIIEQIIYRFNQLVTAASILEGFDIQQYFSDGELVLWSGNALSGMLNQCWEQLGTLARTDFRRAKTMADRFQRFEVQTIARLHLVRGALSQKDSDTVTSGRIINLPLMRTRILHSVHNDRHP